MNHLNKIKEVLQRGFQFTAEYWNKTPTTKIIIINAGIYVLFLFIIVHVEIQTYPRKLYD